MPAGVWLLWQEHGLLESSLTEMPIETGHDANSKRRVKGGLKAPTGRNARVQRQRDIVSALEMPVCVRPPVPFWLLCPSHVWLTTAHRDTLTHMTDAHTHTRTHTHTHTYTYTYTYTSHTDI